MQKYCLIGSPIAHSLSPAMHNRAFSILNIDAEYGLCESDISSLPETVRLLKEKNVSGWNVTMPCKTAMCDLCDELSPEASISRSVNTVKNTDGILHGYTTDGEGFVLAAKQSGFRIESGDITLLGTGGAAVSILISCALHKAAAIHVFYNRDSSAEKIRPVIDRLEEHLSGSAAPEITLEPLRDKGLLAERVDRTDLLVNATNVGMAGSTQASSSPLPDEIRLAPETDIFDAIYNPRETVLLNAARKAGCRCTNGLSMLLFQGAEAFRIWTGRTMPVEIIQQELFHDV